LLLRKRREKIRLQLTEALLGDLAAERLTGVHLEELPIVGAEFAVHADLQEVTAPRDANSRRVDESSQGAGTSKAITEFVRPIHAHMSSFE
jgi:hypothetical protein